MQLHVAGTFSFKPSSIILILSDNHRKEEILLDSPVCKGYSTVHVLCYTILSEAALLTFRDPTKKIFCMFSSLALSVLGCAFLIIHVSPQGINNIKMMRVCLFWFVFLTRHSYLIRYTSIIIFSTIISILK